MIPAFDVGHVLSKLGWATIAVGIEPQFFAGLGKLIEVEARLSVSGMGDAMGKERLSVGSDEPVSVLDLGEGDVFFVFAPGLLLGSGGAEEKNGQ
jgi:hypothetical protein